MRVSSQCMAALVAVGLGAACASAPPVAEQERSSASIRAAEEVGAKAVPQAALHLQLAKEQFEQAKAMKKDRGRAALLLQRSQADAELALALARSENEKSEARSAVDRANQLQREASSVGGATP